MEDNVLLNYNMSSLKMIVVFPTRRPLLTVEKLWIKLCMLLGQWILFSGGNRFQYNEQVAIAHQKAEREIFFTQFKLIAL